MYCGRGGVVKRLRAEFNLNDNLNFNDNLNLNDDDDIDIDYKTRIYMKRIAREEARLRMQPILDRYNALPDVIHPKAEFRARMMEALKGVVIPGIAPHEETILNYVRGKTAPEYEETMAALEGMLSEEEGDRGASRVIEGLRG